MCWKAARQRDNAEVALHTPVAERGHRPVRGERLYPPEEEDSSGSAAYKSGSDSAVEPLQSYLFILLPVSLTRTLPTRILLVLADFARTCAVIVNVL